MARYQPVNRIPLKPRRPASDTAETAAPDDDAAADATDAGGEGDSFAESPARRAHRLRMKAVLAASKPAV